MHHLSQLFILLSSVAAALSADVQVVNVPLTDPSITLVGKAHYNASFCGGFISLPSYGDSLLFPFSGSDVQLDLAALPNEDIGNLTIMPDEVVQQTGPRRFEQLQFFNCSIRDALRYSIMSGFQLEQTNHLLNLTNIGIPQGGGLAVVGLSYFPDRLPTSFPVWTQDASTVKKGLNRVQIAFIVLGSVGGLVALLFLGVVIRRRMRNGGKSKPLAQEPRGTLNMRYKA